MQFLVFFNSIIALNFNKRMSLKVLIIFLLDIFLIRLELALFKYIF